jgi:hypothetical protein
MVCHIHVLSQHNEGMFSSFLKPLSPQSKD